MKTNAVERLLFLAASVILGIGFYFAVSADLTTDATTATVTSGKRLVRAVIDYNDAGDPVKIELVERTFSTDPNHARTLIETSFSLGNVQSWALAKTNEDLTITTNNVRAAMLGRFTQAEVAGITYTNVLRVMRTPSQAWKVAPPPEPPVELPPEP